MSVVRRDIHGLYVKTGGSILRPQVCCWAGGRGFRDAQPNLVGGEKARARRHTGSVFGTVDGQTWYDHGSYYAETANERGVVPELPSEICWAPLGVQRCQRTIMHALTGDPITCLSPVQYGESVCRMHLLAETARMRDVTPIADLLVIQEQP